MRKIITSDWFHLGGDTNKLMICNNKKKYHGDYIFVLSSLVNVMKMFGLLTENDDIKQWCQCLIRAINNKSNNNNNTSKIIITVVDYF